MAYSSITSMSYVSSVNNSGNGVRARFTFEGINNGKLDANDTWAVSLSNTDGPYTMLLNKSTSEQVEGVTAKILTSSAASGNVSGTLELYPLTAGTTYTFQAFDSAYTPSFYFDFTPNVDDTPKIKNLASGTLAESVSASATTLLVFVGNGSASTIKGVWPDTPFYATLMPSNPTAGVPNSLDSEIVKVTDVGNDQVGNTTLSVVRGQRGTTAKAFSSGAIVTNGIYIEDVIPPYSTSEIDTGCKWIDGRKIYRKTLVCSNVPVGEKDYNHGVSNMGLIIKYEGFCKINDTTTLQVPTIASSSGNSFCVWTTYSTYIKVFSTIAMDTFYCTIYYVKTS